MRGRTPNTPTNALLRAVIEIAFIIFLFYSNLLMGEYTRHSLPHQPLRTAIHDIFTAQSLVIALAAGIVGYAVFEALRKRL